MKSITITVDVDVPDDATDKDINDFVDVEYGHVNGMKIDNPCRGDSTEITNASWEYLS